MDVITTSEKKVSPYIYIRSAIPEYYINQLREIGSDIIVEPWVFGEPEPEPTVNLEKINIIFTLGMRDKLDILKKAPNVKWVQSISVGMEAMLHKKIRDSDIVVTNTKGCTSIPIAEHTIAMITSLARGVPTMIRNEQNRIWERISVTDLTGATVGIIGYGQIGTEIAKRCKALGMRVIGCRRNPYKSDLQQEYADAVVGIKQVDQVLAQSNFLVLSLPSTKETRDFLNKDRIEKMKKASYLINVGRGDTIVEEDLIEGLNNGHIAGAALDVFEVEPLPKDHPFWDLKNVIVSPHNAYYSQRYLDRIMDLFIRNVKLFSEGKPLLNVVNKQLGY